MTCRCGEPSRVQTKHTFRRTVAGTTFTAEADVEGCDKCGDVYVPASMMIAFERAVAFELARRGPVSDETFRWIRKAAGVERAELAQILGVAPETIASWEAERRPIERAAWLLVAAMVLDSVEGPRPVRSRVRVPQSPSPGPPELSIPLVASGSIGRVLSLIATPIALTDGDIAETLDVDREALRRCLAELSDLGLVKRAGAIEHDDRGSSWTASTRDRAALFRAAVEAGVDLDMPLPRAPRGDGTKESRLRSNAATWRPPGPT